MRSRYDCLILAHLMMIGLSVPALACDFSTGMSIRNEDSESHVISYNPVALSARVCEVRQSTAHVKRGLVSAEQRVDHNGKLPGFTLLQDSTSADTTSLLPAQTRATLDAGAEVCCLSTWPSAVTIQGLGAIHPKDGQTIIIHPNKTLSVRK